MSSFLIGGREYEIGKKVYIMGILNVTPDSFSDGGKYDTPDKAVEAAVRMVSEGADIIDVGGESTRPGHTAITEEEETERIVPVIDALRERIDVPLSVDTYKYSVAKEAIAAGADMLNSIWGFSKDEKLAELVSQTGVSVCLMHNRDEIWGGDSGQDKSQIVKDDKNAKDPYIDVVLEELKAELKIAEKYGIDKKKIIIDPGVGFGKNQEQNLSVIRHVDRLVETGYPVLMAASRKSVIDYVLDLPVEEREEGTIAISLYAASKGCAMVRIHEVLKNARALKMWQAL